MTGRIRRSAAVMAAGAAAVALGMAAAAVVEFVNIGAEAGLTDGFPNGGAETKRYIIETTGSGAGILDYDHDGLPDLFLISGEGGSNRLYRNLGGLKFADVTKAVGLESNGWGKGVCAGDYDNDGFTDLALTFYGELRLYRNVGGEKFVNTTSSAGLGQQRKRYHAGCAFLDYDRDGDIDLFVSNYVDYGAATAYEPGANPYCFYREMAVNCGPRGLAFDRNQLFRNNGDGTFSDVSEASGIAKPNRNYALGVATGDYNGDGWTDIYVACDQTPSLLYINLGNGRFSEEALLRGTALDENGKALSGMGAAAGDFDGDGWLDIFRTNFSDERATLYRNRGNGEFDDVTVGAGLGHNTRFVGWGCGFLDLDNDTWKDLLQVNGHVFPEVERLKLDIRYRERAIVYRNRGAGRLEDISERSGPGIREAHSSRGAAFGDLDNDGTIEVLINHQNESPGLLRVGGNPRAAEQNGGELGAGDGPSAGRRRQPNGRQEPRGNWLLVELEGVESNRSALGAVVKLRAGGRTQVDEVRSGGSYLSQNDLRLHFGLGAATQVETVEIRWPSGRVQTLRGVEVNRVMKIREDGEPKGNDGPSVRARAAAEGNLPTIADRRVRRPRSREQ